MLCDIWYDTGSTEPNEVSLPIKLTSSNKADISNMGHLTFSPPGGKWGVHVTFNSRYFRFNRELC